MDDNQEKFSLEDLLGKLQGGTELAEMQEKLGCASCIFAVAEHIGSKPCCPLAAPMTAPDGSCYARTEGTPAPDEQIAFERVAEHNECDSCPFPCDSRLPEAVNPSTGKCACRGVAIGSVAQWYRVRVTKLDGSELCSTRMESCAAVNKAATAAVIARDEVVRLGMSPKGLRFTVEHEIVFEGDVGEENND